MEPGFLHEIGLFVPNSPFCAVSAILMPLLWVLLSCYGRGRVPSPPGLTRPVEIYLQLLHEHLNPSFICKIRPWK